MEKNIKIAKQLVKIAKSLVALGEEEEKTNPSKEIKSLKDSSILTVLKRNWKKTIKNIDDEGILRGNIAQMTIGQIIEGLIDVVQQQGNNKK